MKKWQKYSIIGVAAALVLGLVIWGCVALWPDPVGPIITAPTETTEPVLAATVPDTTAPMETEPTETTVPVTEPEVTHGEEVTEPVVTEPEETQPKETEPEVTEPQKPTEPKPTDPPKPTEPKETQPKPTNPPKETQPKPTNPPKETQPKPTEPPATTAPKDEASLCYGGIEHAFEGTLIKPTCTSEGYWRYVCTTCLYEYREDYVPALGGSHSYEVKKIVEPTGATRGYTVYKCSKCGHEYKDDYVDMLPPEKIDIAALEEYGRQYAASLGYTPSTVPGFDNNAGYFPPILHTIRTMEDGKRAARSAVDYQYDCDLGGNREIAGRVVNVRFIATGEPDCYLVYCFYGGLGT